MKFLHILFLALFTPMPVSLANFDYWNCEQFVQLPLAATRVVTLDINSTEIALALGLPIIGVAGVGDRSLIMDSYQTAAQKLNFLSPFYPSLVQLQNVSPDLVIGGWKNGFSRGTAIEPGSLQSKGIASYVLRETCVHDAFHVSKPVTFAATLFQDLLAIGSITGTSSRAEQLVLQMQSRLARVSDDVQTNGRAVPVRVLVYDGGFTDALTIGGEALLSEAIRLAGGRNIFSEQPGTWQIASWPSIVQADPEIILLVDYGLGDAFYKRQDIEQNAELQSISAVRNQQYFVIPYSAAINGIRSVGLTELFADHLICAFNSFSQGETRCLDVPSVF